MRSMFPLPASWSEVFILYGISLSSCLTTFFVLYPFSYLMLFHALFHAFVIPTLLFWALHTLLYGQKKEVFLITCLAAVHPGYFLDITMSPTLCGVSGALLLFVILAINTFHFSWAILPRQVIETTLMYAPEMGFLSTQYDVLIDEMGYNEWYARHRTLWLLAIGLALGALMTVSLFFLLLGLALMTIYLFVSSSWESAAKKISCIGGAAGFVLMLLYLGSPRLFSLAHLYPRFSLDVVKEMFLFFGSPSLLLIWQVSDFSLTARCLLAFFAIVEVFFALGFLGICYLLIRKNMFVRHVIKILPFFFIALFAILAENNSALFWATYPLMMVMGGIFWMTSLKDVFPFLSSDA